MTNSGNHHSVSAGASLAVGKQPKLHASPGRLKASKTPTARVEKSRNKLNRSLDDAYRYIIGVQYDETQRAQRFGEARERKEPLQKRLVYDFESSSPRLCSTCNSIIGTPHFINDTHFHHCHH